MKVGYARVSPEYPILSPQFAALKTAGCDPVFADSVACRTSSSHAGLEAALAAVSSGDAFVVWSLDRLGHSLATVIRIINQLRTKDVDFISLSEHLDTRRSDSAMMFAMVGVLAQFELSDGNEHLHAGMHLTEPRGKRPRRQNTMTQEQCDEARALLMVLSATQVAQKYGIHPKTLRRILLRPPHTADR